MHATNIATLNEPKQKRTHFANLLSFPADVCNKGQAAKMSHSL